MTGRELTTEQVNMAITWLARDKGMTVEDTKWALNVLRFKDVKLPNLVLKVWSVRDRGGPDKYDTATLWELGTYVHGNAGGDAGDVILSGQRAVRRAVDAAGWMQMVVRNARKVQRECGVDVSLDDYLDWPVELVLSNRTANALAGSHVDTLRRLLYLDSQRYDIASASHLGAVGVHELVQSLSDHGYGLRYLGLSHAGRNKIKTCQRKFEDFLWTC